MTKPESKNEYTPRCNRILRRLVCAFAVVGLSAALDGIGLLDNSIFAADVAQAEDEAPELSEKEYWQSRYRELLEDQARLRDNAAKSRKNYSRARLVNYPRGGARDQFRLDAEEAEQELIKVTAETEELLEQARRDAVPRHWIYEVDDEDIQAPAATAPVERDDSRDGRNPLYLDD